MSIGTGWLASRQRKLGAVALLLVVLATVGFLIIRNTAEGEAAGTRTDPWGSAGIKNLKISVRVEGALTYVDVEVSTSLPVEDSANRSGFGRRVAKIAWRNHRGPMDVLVVGSAVGGKWRQQRWQRAELEGAFGARPARLDEGQAPPAPPATAEDGEYHDFPAADTAAAEEWQRRLLTEIGRDHLGVAAASPTVQDRHACYDGLFGGIFGESATGDYQADVELELTLPGDGDPEARLPALADHLAGLGLRVRTDLLDDGLPDVMARFGEEGRLSVTVVDAAPGAPRRVLIGTSSECLAP
ncbi:hypothetical protein GCM10010168_14340 [Actinoplanes ianthinogenes]|uniref:Uncharacterized protein n=1 Tax=Actinoplanes ianthinogenes TaxID=122358 RepID=A0ABM7LZ74_9ACTN|nr:hypothetical protein [Actinoplanes ianthinogenes]BCJ44621.1 hypothetical protein Aiant_52780 [Actinoplanes ianthinogenes]GGQ99087.1 hypothetical protein GCM10010168_14340 [Actinoplanes ianthinogenes]